MAVVISSAIPHPLLVGHKVKSTRPKRIESMKTVPAKPKTTVIRRSR